MTLLVAVGKKVGDKSDRYYAAVKDEEHGTSVARIPTAGADSLVQEFADPTALRSKTLVALGGFKKPLAVRVTNEAASWSSSASRSKTRGGSTATARK